MRRYLSVLFLIVAFITDAHSQATLPDSIAARYSGLTQDANYVDKLNETATSYLRSNPAAARKVCAHTMDIANKIKYTRGYARALTVMGNSYWYEGIYEFAQNYYLLAARQYQSVNDSIGLGQTYNNIGEVYKKLEEYEKALEYLIKSTELKKRDSSTRAITLYNIGELYVRLNQIDRARGYIQEAFDFASKENNRRVIAYTNWSMAEIAKKQRRYADALTRLREAERLWSELGEIRSLIQTYQEMAQVHRLQGDYTSAEESIQKSIDLAGQIKVADLQVKNYLLYATLDSIRGNYARALVHLAKHNELKDSVYNLLKAEQIARLQTIYETENREQENQRLRSEGEVKNAELYAQRITLIAISTGLLLAGILAWLLYRQQKKILFQKEAIEIQATALLKLNEELHDLNKTLEARIDQRTSQLTFQNQRLAEYTFINAHKLRAPVASILGLIHLMDQVSEEERELVMAHLRTCCEELDQVIRSVSRDLENAIVKEAEPHH